MVFAQGWKPKEDGRFLKDDAQKGAKGLAHK